MIYFVAKCFLISCFLWDFINDESRRQQTDLYGSLKGHHLLYKSDIKADIFIALIILLFSLYQVYFGFYEGSYKRRLGLYYFWAPWSNLKIKFN